MPRHATTTPQINSLPTFNELVIVRHPPARNPDRISISIFDSLSLTPRLFTPSIAHQQSWLPRAIRLLRCGPNENKTPVGARRLVWKIHAFVIDHRTRLRVRREIHLNHEKLSFSRFTNAYNQSTYMPTFVCILYAGMRNISDAFWGDRFFFAILLFWRSRRDEWKYYVSGARTKWSLYDEIRVGTTSWKKSTTFQTIFPTLNSEFLR